MNRWTRRTRWAALVAVVSLAFGTVTAGAEQSDAELRAERERLRSEQAVLAGQIDVQKASVEEVTAALAAAEANVRQQQALLEEAQAEVDQAEADRAAAEARQEAAEAEIEGLKDALRAMAINAYINPPQQDTLHVMLEGDIARAPERQALLDLQVADQADVLDRFRIVQEDLERYAKEALEAEERAEEAKKLVEERLEELEEARNIQADLAARAQALLDGLMEQDAALEQSASRITSELARREEVRRQEERRRQEELAKQIAEANARRGDVSLPNGTTVSVTRVGGIVVNTAIAGQVQAMLAAAAADGLTLTGGGYRDHSVQIRLRQVNGCPDIWTARASSCRVPTAIPGTSMHERGLAIDFNNCSTRSTACFQWLAANAARFGFRNLPSEPWHWSTTGG